jgi:hypothetical protein
MKVRSLSRTDLRPADLDSRQDLRGSPKGPGEESEVSLPDPLPDHPLFRRRRSSRGSADPWILRSATPSAILSPSALNLPIHGLLAHHIGTHGEIPRRQEIRARAPLWWSRSARVPGIPTHTHCAQTPTNGGGTPTAV